MNNIKIKIFNQLDYRSFESLEKNVNDFCKGKIVKDIKFTNYKNFCNI